MAPDTVADIVGRTEPECAELADRARHCLRTRRSHPTTPEEHDALVRAVRQACASEDAELLASLLCPDATAFFDGGGKVRTLIRPAHGSRRVAHSLLTLLAHRPRTTLTTHSVNGRTGLVARYDRRVAAVISLDITDHRVAQADSSVRTPSSSEGGPDRSTTTEQPSRASLGLQRGRCPYGRRPGDRVVRPSVTGAAEGRAAL